MTCERMKTLLVELTYDELDGDARREAETHLRDCPACRDELATLRGVRRRLGDGSPEIPEAPPIRVALPARVARGPLWAAAAALLVAGMLSVLALGGATVSWGDDGFTLAFGEQAPDEETLIQAARLEAREEVNRAIDDRLAGELRPVSTIDALRPYIVDEIEARDDKLLRYVNDRQSRWEQEREQRLRESIQAFNAATDRTHNLFEYTLLASQAPRVVEH